jgi:hypothetical protein
MNDRVASRAVSKIATPQERRSKPRFLHMFKMMKAGQAAGYSSSRESGIKKTPDVGPAFFSINVPRHAVCCVILNLLSQVGTYRRVQPWPKPIASPS